MLPKNKRVNKKTFQILMKDGKTLSSSFFLLYFIKTEDYRCAFVAPKKSFKTAVNRNKYRRLGYNVIRELGPFNANTVFMFKKEAINQKKEEIKKDLYSLVKKAGLIK